MSRHNPVQKFKCDICNHTVDGYAEFEEHRAYFHKKDVEKSLVPTCPNCGGELEIYGCKNNCWASVTRLLKCERE